jgi:diguanylate cyclase (GGDEF)-like protein
VQALSEEQRELIAERDELRRRSMLDALTRTWNRGAIEEVLARELARAARDGSPLSVIMADVDHFKRVNDSFGHPAGDAVLNGVVRGMRSALRPYDAIGRYGGEEFLVVLPRCDAASARTIAERMRRRVESEPVETTASMVSATLSLGVASAGAPLRRDPQALIETADGALYQAKERGRNQVVVAA